MISDLCRVIPTYWYTNGIKPDHCPAKYLGFCSDRWKKSLCYDCDYEDASCPADNPLDSLRRSLEENMPESLKKMRRRRMLKKKAKKTHSPTAGIPPPPYS